MAMLHSTTFFPFYHATPLQKPHKPLLSNHKKKKKKKKKGRFCAMGSLAVNNQLQGAPEAKLMVVPNNGYQKERKEKCCSFFQMPLHYPRYTRADYEKMPEWRLDCLLREYGLPVFGDLDHKRKFAMGAFLWP